MVKNKQSNRIVALYKYGHEHSQKIIIGEVVPGYFNKEKKEERILLVFIYL